MSGEINSSEQMVQSILERLDNPALLLHERGIDDGHLDGDVLQIRSDLFSLRQSMRHELGRELTVVYVLMDQMKAIYADQISALLTRVSRLEQGAAQA
jgi:hypothetical protein